MGFELTNFTVSILFLLGWCVFTIYGRVTGPLHGNGPLTFWIVLTAITLKWPGANWKFEYVAAGLVLCLLLRFEFMNDTFATIIRVLEMVAFGYVLFYGVQLLYK